MTTIQAYAKRHLRQGEAVCWDTDIYLEQPNILELFIQAAATKTLYDYASGKADQPMSVLYACERVGADAETMIRMVRRDELEMIGDRLFGKIR